MHAMAVQDSQVSYLAEEVLSPGDVSGEGERRSAETLVGETVDAERQVVLRGDGLLRLDHPRVLRLQTQHSNQMRKNRNEATCSRITSQRLSSEWLSLPSK